MNIGSILDQLKWRRMQAYRRHRAAARTRPEQEPALRAELDKPIGEQFLAYLTNPFSTTINSARSRLCVNRAM